MARRPLFFCLLLFLLLAAALPTASAVEEITQEHTKYFSLEAPEGLSLSGVYLYDLDPNSNTTLYLDNYGKTYTLQINSTKSYLAWWEFEITLTNPNGTVQTKSLSSLTPYATDYDFHLQYYWQQYIPGDTSSYDSVFDIDVYTGILPLEAAIIDPYSSLATTQLNFGSDNLNVTALKFSEISVSSTSYFDLICFAVTDEEFATQYYKEALGAIKEGLSDFFEWTWNSILSFVELIPYIGDDLVTAILIASYIIDETFFYFNLFFVEYIETTILSIEFFAITYSIIRTKSKSPVKLVKNVVTDQIAVLDFIIDKARLAIELLIRIINAIAQIVQSLKPI